jgi:hypothetical protein
MMSELGGEIRAAIIEINKNPHSIHNIFKENDLDTNIKITRHMLDHPLRYERCLGKAIQLLVEDSMEYASLLNDVLNETSVISSQAWESLKALFKSNPDIALSLSSRMLTLNTSNGISSGVILAWIMPINEDGFHQVIGGLTSADEKVRMSSITATGAVLSNDSFPRRAELLDALAKGALTTTQVSRGLFFTLQRACRHEPVTFEKIIRHLIKKFGVEASRIYIPHAQYEPGVSIDALKVSVETLELNEGSSDLMDDGLAIIYKHDKHFVVEKLRNRLLAHEPLYHWNSRLYEIVGKDPLPIINMLKQEIGRNGVSIDFKIVYELDDLLKHDRSTWVGLCQEWVSDPCREYVILHSIGILLKEMVDKDQYGMSEEKRNCISMVRDISQRHALDFEKETSHINLRRSQHPGLANKEEAFKALFMAKKILFWGEPVDDLATLEDNLRRAPSILRLVGGLDNLLRTAKSERPHVLCSIFGGRRPAIGELESLGADLNSTSDVNKQLGIALEHDRLLDNHLSQNYWEEIAKKYIEAKLTVKREKLLDVDNAFNILSEIEVFAHLSESFEIERDIVVEGFGKKRLEGRITLNNETSLIEIATVNESLENSLAIGVFTPTPPKIEDKLRDKLSRQFCQGTVDPGEPLIVVLHCSRFKFSHKIPRVETTVVDEKFVFEELPTKEEDAVMSFFSNDAARVVSAVIIYYRDLSSKHPLVGITLPNPNSPLHIPSEEFMNRLKMTLFGNP